MMSTHKETLSLNMVSNREYRGSYLHSIVEGIHISSTAQVHSPFPTVTGYDGASAH